MKIGELLDLMKLSLALVGVMAAVLTACTATGSSPIVPAAEVPRDDNVRRGVIIRTIDLDELSALREVPPTRSRVSHLAHRQADSD